MARKLSYTQVNNFSSIRAKLLIIVLLFIVGICGYAFFQHSSLVKLNKLENAAKSNLTSEIELLTLRRHEKDFLSRKDTKYIQRFDNTIQTLRNRVIELGQTLNPFDEQIAYETKQIVETLDKYKAQFHQLADLVLEIGATTDVGLLGKQYKSQQTLQNTTESLDNEGRTQVLNLIQLELNYLLSPSKGTSEKIVAKLDALKPLSH